METERELAVGHRLCAWNKGQKERESRGGTKEAGGKQAWLLNGGWTTVALTIPAVGMRDLALLLLCKLKKDR